MTEILIILILILINGLFSMAEIALVSARKARLEGQALKGDHDARRALKLANHPETFLSTVQIGITLISVLTGIFSGDRFKAGKASFFENRITKKDCLHFFRKIFGNLLFCSP
jgi:putative hemolysin